MNNSIQKAPEMRDLQRHNSFMASSQDKINDGTITSPDTIITMTVLLVACLALAVLAHAAI